MSRTWSRFRTEAWQSHHFGNGFWKDHYLSQAVGIVIILAELQDCDMA